MSFLKSFGKKFLEGVKVAGGIAPTLARLTPTTIDDGIAAGIASLSMVVAQVEIIGQMQGLSGEDKLRIAEPFVTNAVMSSPIMQGKKVADPALFKKAISGMTGSVADLLNSLKAEGSK